MSRTGVTFLVLAAAGGCFSVNRDPLSDPERVPAVPPAQVRTATGTWYRADGVPVTAAAAPGAAQARQSSYAPTDPRIAAARTAGMLPPAPTPAADPSTGAATAGAPRADDPIDQSLVQATMVVTPRTARGQQDYRPDYSSPPPPPSPPPAPPAPPPAPAPMPDLTSMPLPRIVTGKGPEGLPRSAAGPAANTALRLVSSRRIQFNFEVRDPAAGMPVVELWGTRDLKSWQKYEAVAHPPHTLVAEVKDEGLYGFSLLARSGAAAPRGPLPGDLPQIWVAVDSTRPVVQLQGAELNLSARVPTLVLSWSATDRNLGSRPVTLSYAEQNEGPWTPIAANLENNGRYEWVLPGAVPPVLHLRVQAADLMGNIGTAQTTSPLYLPRLQPTGASVAQVEKTERPAPEPERPAPPPPPRLVNLPPAPITDLPRPAPVEPPRPQVNILSVDGDHN